MSRLTQTSVLLLTLAAVALVVVLVVGSMTMIDHDEIVFRVRLKSPVPVREAGTEVYARPEGAADGARDYPTDALQNPVPPAALTGESFVVRAWVITRNRWFGFQHSRVQQTGLLVVAVLADGRRVAKVVELPEADPQGRDDPEVTVALD